ncbi:MAG: hypothetical protein OIF50_02355 [Flavobacteriaceae bacterium]|nr:hypothetical protein [Flavobacteriaceae bacterium]
MKIRIVLVVWVLLSIACKKDITITPEYLEGKSFQYESLDTPNSNVPGSENNFVNGYIMKIEFLSKDSVKASFSNFLQPKMEETVRYRIIDNKVYAELQGIQGIFGRQFVLKDSETLISLHNFTGELKLVK